MLQLDEKALAAVGMSMMWALSNPRAEPIYGYKNKGNILPNGWWCMVLRIHDNFHHPIEASLSVHVTTPIGAHTYAPTRSEVVKSHARMETILLSSEESTGPSNELIHRSSATRIGPLVRPIQGDEGVIVVNPVIAEPRDVTAAPIQQTPSARARPGVQTGKHSSRLRYLDYVEVSNTFSGLDVGVKRTAACIEEDQATLTQMMEKKRKLLSETKQQLDTVVGLDISERKRKVMAQLTAPSDSEVDLGLFAKKSTNILEDLYEDMGFSFLAPAKASSTRSKCSVSWGSKPTAPDISTIPTLESPPIAVYGDSHFHGPVHLEDIKGKGSESSPMVLTVDRFQPSVLPRVVFHEGVEGLETEVESSEATPPGVRGMRADRRCCASPPC
ncbi:hypothetical protein Hanom_Chr15g01405501 [Helianthus anomalus]